MQQETTTVVSSSTVQRISSALILIACAGAGIAVWVLSPVRIAAAVTLLALSLVLLQHAQLGVTVLAIATLFSGVSAEIGSVTVRPDQLITLLLLIVLLVHPHKKKTSIRISSLTIWILLYLAANLISSLMHAPDLRTSLQRCVLLGITCSAYFVTEQFLTSRKAVDRLLKILLVAGFLETLFGIVSVILLPFGIQTGGAYYQGRDQLYARGTMLEGNIFGCFAMMMALILQALILSPVFRKHRSLLVVMYSAAIIASILSFTRAAWLSWLIGSLFYALVIQRGRIKPLFSAAKWIVPALGFTVIFVLILSTRIKVHDAYLIDLYKDRIARIAEYKSGTGSQRLLIWTESLKLWTRNPLFGNGTDSVKALGSETKMLLPAQGYWIPNSLILTLHDTGIVGLITFAGIQIAVLRRLWKASSFATPHDRVLLEGLLTAFVGVQIAYLFTNAFWLIFIWVFMGIAQAVAKFSSRMIPSSG